MNPLKVPTKPHSATLELLSKKRANLDQGLVDLMFTREIEEEAMKNIRGPQGPRKTKENLRKTDEEKEHLGKIKEYL